MSKSFIPRGLPGKGLKANVAGEAGNAPPPADTLPPDGELSLDSVGDLPVPTTPPLGNPDGGTP